MDPSTHQLRGRIRTLVWTENRLEGRAAILKTGEIMLNFISQEQTPY